MLRILLGIVIRRPSKAFEGFRRPWDATFCVFEVLLGGLYLVNLMTSTTQIIEITMGFLEFFVCVKSFDEVVFRSYATHANLSGRHRASQV